MEIMSGTMKVAKYKASEVMELKGESSTATFLNQYDS